MGFPLVLGAHVTGNGGDEPPLPIAQPSAPLMATLTAYNAVPEQTDEVPDVTASGAFSNPEVVAARSRDMGEVLPFGTIIAIEGPAATSSTCGYTRVGRSVGYRVIADTMNPKFTKRLDVLLASTTEAIRLGVCSDVRFRIVGRIDVRKMPATQKELVSIVKKIEK